MFRSLPVIVLCLSSLLNSNRDVAAQQRTPFSGRQAMQQRFDRAAPELGAILPDLRAHDEQGNAFALRAQRGQYTVLVFGCLT